VDAELNKLEAERSAKSADAQEKKSSIPAVSDTVETAGFYDSFIAGILVKFFLGSHTISVTVL